MASTADGWIRVADIDRSIFAYGLTKRPYAHRSKLVLAEGRAPLAHDLISWLGLQTQAAGAAPLEYLEKSAGVHTMPRHHGARAPQ